jgi:hypothetical protein
MPDIKKSADDDDTAADPPFDSWPLVIEFASIAISFDSPASAIRVRAGFARGAGLLPANECARAAVDDMTHSRARLV